MATIPEIPTDGRIQRSERSREAIVQALFDLVGEGLLVPTAQQVAERANVGVRSVFRHFSDMDTLFAELNERLMKQLEALLVTGDQSGSLAERTNTLIERRVKIFEIIAPYYRADVIQRWRSDFLREQHEATVKTFQADLHRWLPELSSMDNVTADGIEVILSFECWNRLRSEQKLGVKRAEQVLHRMVSAALSLGSSDSAN